jgi:hypothetical protein
MLLSQLSQRPSSPLLLRRAPPYLSDFFASLSHSADWTAMLSSTNAFFLDLLMPGTSGAPSLASASPVDRRTDFGYIDADRGEKWRISSLFFEIKVSTLLPRSSTLSARNVSERQVDSY